MKGITLGIASTLLIGLFAVLAATQGDRPKSASASERKTIAWPNWMGPRLDGVSHETGWSTHWPEGGLKTRWSSEIGIGFSSVSIAEGRLFTMGHVDGEDVVYCLAVESGKKVWTHRTETALIDNLYEGGPGATPTIDANRVYTLGKEGQLSCFDASSGDVRWQKSLQSELGVGLPEWGFNCSPLILGDHVLVEAGRVACFDKHSGEKIWQTEEHTAGYGCVRAFEQDSETLLTSLDCDALRLWRATDGAPLDSFPWPSPFGTNSTTPIVHNNTIFVSTGYQVGCGLFRCDDQKLELIYDHRKMRNHFNNSILYQEKLYGFDGNSNLGRVVHLTCMDHATGEIDWTHRGLGCGSLMVANGKLLILSDDGRLVVAETGTDEYREIAAAEILEGRCWTVPVLLDGRVYARSARGKLVCVELP